MLSSNYLLIIDNVPITADFEKYFQKFNIKLLIHQNTSILNTEHKKPYAVLIHWRIVADDLQALKQIYHSYPVPIIVISEKANNEACICVLESGADDFIVQPITAKEVHARIIAIHRRIAITNQTYHPKPNFLRFAHWRLHPASRQIFNVTDNKELLLSAGEYDLLYTFVQKPQRVLNRELLLHKTKQSTQNPFDRRIDVQISRLRQKIELNAKEPTLIKTVRNGGYIFTAQVKSCKPKLEEMEVF